MITFIKNHWGKMLVLLVTHCVVLFAGAVVAVFPLSMECATIKNDLKEKYSKFPFTNIIDVDKAVECRPEMAVYLFGRRIN